MAVVSLKKRSVLSPLVWSNLPKRTFSGLSIPRPPKPRLQTRASQGQASHSMSLVSLKKRSVLSSLVWSNLPNGRFQGYRFQGLQNHYFKLALHRPKPPIQWLLFLSRNVRY